MVNSRNLMVQTLAQYTFIYRVIEEFLDKTLCDALTEGARKQASVCSVTLQSQC
jgi:hypothetical protein